MQSEICKTAIDRAIMLEIRIRHGQGLCAAQRLVIVLRYDQALGLEI